MDAGCTAAAITEDSVEVPDTSGSLGMVEDSESSVQIGNDINAVHTASLVDLQGGEATEELVISTMAMETLTYSSDPEVLFCIRLHLCRGLRGISRSFAMANCIFLHAAFASSGIVPVQLPTLSTLLHICDPE